MFQDQKEKTSRDQNVVRPQVCHKILLHRCKIPPLRSCQLLLQYIKFLEEAQGSCMTDMQTMGFRFCCNKPHAHAWPLQELKQIVNVGSASASLLQFSSSKSYSCNLWANKQGHSTQAANLSFKLYNGIGFLGAPSKPRSSDIDNEQEQH